ncbi:ATP-binding protein [Rapidithrix thailandica]|uniref:histidine kinase n=1 Tax=Rapidithrix thailandica TaxID=413964 RepID=A0AAW9S684_9BACT
MLVNSKAVSFLLAASISVVTVAFVSLVEGVSTIALFVAGALSFSSSFLLIYITLEFLVFKEIDEIYKAFDKVRKKDFKSIVRKKTYSSQNPLKRINAELVDYASLKHQEIEELKKAEAYRREFIADVSHELKTPIFAAQGYILTLLDGAVDDDKVKYKFLKKAAKSLNGLDSLVQDLLTLSKIESGVITMHYEVFDIQSLALDIFEQLENKAHKRSIQLMLEKNYPEGIYVNADYSRISQVLINLVSNAIKYNQDGGWVKVRFDEKEKEVLITVTDNGLGIPEEDIARVFERFYRVEKSRSKKQGGSGLGLAIVKHILEGHNASISVDSEENKGTSFSFNLEKGVLNNEEVNIQRTDSI